LQYWLGFFYLTVSTSGVFGGLGDGNENGGGDSDWQQFLLKTFLFLVVADDCCD
jgi:hypothetical protein